MDKKKIMPRSIENAVILLWIIIGMYTTAGIIDVTIGKMNLKELTGVIIQQAIWAIFPYKIARRSNITKWIYTTLYTGAMLAILLAIALGNFEINIDKIPPFTKAAAHISMPIDIAIIYFLFKKESSVWFRSN